MQRGHDQRSAPRSKLLVRNLRRMRVSGHFGASLRRRRTKVLNAGSFTSEPKLVVERRLQVFRLRRDIRWSPIRVRATVQQVRTPFRYVNINRFGNSDVGIHRPENLHDLRLDFIRSELLDVERPISLKQPENSGRRGPESTYSDRDKDYVRTGEESNVIQALPDGIPSSLLRCIQSHLMRRG